MLFFFVTLPFSSTHIKLVLLLLLFLLFHWRRRPLPLRHLPPQPPLLGGLGRRDQPHPVLVLLVGLVVVVVLQGVGVVRRMRMVAVAVVGVEVAEVAVRVVGADADADADAVGGGGEAAAAPADRLVPVRDRAERLPAAQGVVAAHHDAADADADDADAGNDAKPPVAAAAAAAAAAAGAGAAAGDDGGAGGADVHLDGGGLGAAVGTPPCTTKGREKMLKTRIFFFFLGKQINSNFRFDRSGNFKCRRCHHHPFSPQPRLD